MVRKAVKRRKVRVKKLQNQFKSLDNMAQKIQTRTGGFVFIYPIKSLTEKVWINSGKSFKNALNSSKPIKNS